MKLPRLLATLCAAILATTSAATFGQDQASNTSAADTAPPWPILKPSKQAEPLAGTAPLTMDGDLASEMVAGIDKFLLRQIDESVAKREQHWQRDFSSPDAYTQSVEPNRQRLQKMLGIVDQISSGSLIYTNADGFPIQEKAGKFSYTIYNIRWPVTDDLTGVGLLLVPAPGTEIVGDVVAIPDADQSPLDIASSWYGSAADSTDGKRTSTRFADHLARCGCRVLIPLLIDRSEHKYKMPNREWLHRPAYELGRSLAGCEVQKVLAAIDALQDTNPDRRVGVIGWGEGGRLALYAGALDTRIAATCVAGYFGSRQTVWDEPADRTVFGLLKEFGDAETASLIAPRSLLVESGPSPEFVFRPDSNGRPQILQGRAPKNGKPGALIRPSTKESQEEFQRAENLVSNLQKSTRLEFVENKSSMGIGDQSLQKFLAQLGTDASPSTALADSIVRIQGLVDFSQLHARQLSEIERHNQRLLENAYQERIEYFKDLKTVSLEAFNGSIESYREKFRRDVVGEFDIEKLPLHPRSRPFQEGPKTISYEVVLDVFPDVFAYGILTLPKDLKLDGSEKRPVVVCQHGLEGRPQDVIGESKFKAYAAFATRLAERGFITFAPQNPYIFFDRFRTLQFKSAALGCTLFSTIVPQHQQITDWLQTQPYVDGDRIGFYGLSYGGKSAMRIPPLVSDYALSICSADFNEWVWKNAATDQRSLRYSYANKGEYEIFEFGLGRTFNYAEMSYLICPRPFMVERGHFDGVGPDDRVAQEFAKIRFLYQAKLGIGERTEIEWFPGPHTIHGVGSFDFLHHHLNWPAPQ